MSHPICGAGGRGASTVRTGLLPWSCRLRVGHPSRQGRGGQDPQSVEADRIIQYAMLVVAGDGPVCVDLRPRNVSTTRLPASRDVSGRFHRRVTGQTVGDWSRMAGTWVRGEERSRRTGPSLYATPFPWRTRNVTDPEPRDRCGAGVSWSQRVQELNRLDKGITKGSRASTKRHIGWMTKSPGWTRSIKISSQLAGELRRIGRWGEAGVVLAKIGSGLPAYQGLTTGQASGNRSSSAGTPAAPA